MTKRTKSEQQAYLDGFKAALEWAEAKDVEYAWIVYQFIKYAMEHKESAV